MIPLAAQELYDRELDNFRRLFDTAGGTRWLALFNAIKYCHTVQIVLPEWTIKAIMQLIQDRHFADHDTSMGGGYSSTSGRLNMDYAHFLRWRAVKLKLQMEGMNDLPSRRKGRPKPGDITKVAVLKQAAIALRGNRLARAQSEREIETSYRVVQASLSKGEARFMFDLLLEI
jgi:hypothetical protein